jgi:hypothetical protein
VLAVQLERTAASVIQLPQQVCVGLLAKGDPDGHGVVPGCLLRGVERERAIGRGSTPAQRPLSPGRERRLEAQLFAEDERLDSVVGEHLTELVESAGHLALKVDGEPVVEGCPVQLRERVVRDIPDKQMSEANGPSRPILAVSLEEALTNQALGRRSGRLQKGEELVDREAFAHHARRLEGKLLTGRQRVDPRCDDRLDRVGKAEVEHIGHRLPPPVRELEIALFDEHPQELFAEQRIAGGSLCNLGSDDQRKLIDSQEA